MTELQKLQAEYDAEQKKWRAMIQNGGSWHDEYAVLRDRMDEIDLRMTAEQLKECK